MLSEFRRVLVPSGILIISSPNKPIYLAATSPPTSSIRELTRDELAVLLTPGFPRQRWYGQRAFAHSLLWVERPDSLGESGLRSLSRARCARWKYLYHRCTLSLFAVGPTRRCPSSRRCRRSSDRIMAPGWFPQKDCFVSRHRLTLEL
jgi:hypothetical protein